MSTPPGIKKSSLHRKTNSLAFQNNDSKITSSHDPHVISSISYGETDYINSDKQNLDRKTVLHDFLHVILPTIDPKKESTSLLRNLVQLVKKKSNKKSQYEHDHIEFEKAKEWLKRNKINLDKSESFKKHISAFLGKSYCYMDPEKMQARIKKSYNEVSPDIVPDKKPHYANLKSDAEKIIPENLKPLYKDRDKRRFKIMTSIEFDESNNEFKNGIFEKAAKMIQNNVERQNYLQNLENASLNEDEFYNLIMKYDQNPLEESQNRAVDYYVNKKLMANLKPKTRKDYFDEEWKRVKKLSKLKQEKFDELKKKVHDTSCFESIQKVFATEGNLCQGMQALYPALKKNVNTNEKYDDWAKICQAGDLAEKLIRYKGANLIKESKKKPLLITKLIPKNVLEKVDKIIEKSNKDLKKQRTKLLQNSLDKSLKKHGSLDLKDQISGKTQNSKNYNDEVTIEEVDYNENSSLPPTSLLQPEDSKRKR